MMENKPICEIDKYRTKRWFLNGIYHREDGPAIEYLDGTKVWFKCGATHRLDGPAIIYHDGRVNWCVNGYSIMDRIENWAHENDIDLNNLTEVDKALIKLVWADYDGK